MTQPQDVPMIDQGNALLAQVPATMTTGTVDTPAGKLLVMTVRTTSATLTVLLGKDDATAWARALGAEADAMSGLAVSGLAVVSQPTLAARPH